MSLQYIRKYYGVSAFIGRRVKIAGKPGVIAEAINQYIGVLFDDAKPNNIMPCHPTHMVEYLEMGEVRPMTRSQRRYHQWLDSDSGLSFGEWIRLDWREL